MTRLGAVFAGAILLICVSTGCSPGRGSPELDLNALAVQAAGSIRDAARELGREPFEAGLHPSEASIDRFLDVLGRSSGLFGGPVIGQESANGKKVTPAVVAGMELTVAEVLKSVPGGVQFPDAESQESVANLDASAEKKRFGRLSQEDLEVKFKDMFRALAVLALFTDENLVRQAIPPGSQWSTALADKGFVDQAGQIKVPAPPVLNEVVNTGWNRFADALEPVRAVSRVSYRAGQRWGL